MKFVVQTNGKTSHDNCTRSPASPGPDAMLDPRRQAKLLTAAMAPFPTIKHSTIQKPIYILNKQKIVCTKKGEASCSLVGFENQVFRFES